MGRQISRSWGILSRLAGSFEREQEERTDLLVEMMSLNPMRLLPTSDRVPVTSV